MMDFSEEAIQFLQELYRQCGGDPTGTFSMFDIGEAVGLDKDRAGAVGEELIGRGLVEVRTLSGGVALAESGIEKARELSGESSEEKGRRPQLGTGPVLDESGLAGGDRVVSRLKSGIDDLGFGFEGLAEMMADLKSIDAQLASPRPKTAVIRECFGSILELLQGAGAADQAREVKQLLGE